MKRRPLFSTGVLVLLFALNSVGQHLPTGTYHPNHERTYDIVHYRSDLKLDWIAKKVFGESTIRLRPFTRTSKVSLGAFWLSVRSVRSLPDGNELAFASTDSTLVIDFGGVVEPSDTLTLGVSHSSNPTAGVYFVDAPAGSGGLPTVYSYGEGGLHANWLPIYAYTNDKFSTELSVTVSEPYRALSNGTLLEEEKNNDGTRTFHWLQQLPHSPYLIALFVNDDDSVQLRPAFGTIPLTCWVPRGRKEEGRYAFRNTTRMVEFFSNIFQYRYPWDKYDQVAVYDYAIGAMENTSLTGHRLSVLRTPSGPADFGPEFDTYESNWTAEATISHELAHHWFGDNLTCRSLGSIWLNESFATYCMMLWEGNEGGKEYMQFKVWQAVRKYLRYVKEKHIIRPMEYRRYDTLDEIYNEEHTYLKGGAVLHMLRWILGDQDFFKSLSYYLHKHEFSNVESTDLKIAIEEATGKNLTWFFDQWVYGAGHPRFEVTYRYHQDRKALDLTVKQTQPLVEGQGIFKLPVEVRIDTDSKTVRDTVWVENLTDHFTFSIDEKPRMVSFDGQGMLVCELVFDKRIAELTYQVQHDALAGRLWALRELARNHPGSPSTLDAIRKVLMGDGSWWLKAEAALQLRNIHSLTGEQLLIDQLKASDYRVRKAAAIALGTHYTVAASSALRRAVESDPQTDVASAAIVSLANVDSSLAPSFFRVQMSRQSWYEELRIASLKAVEILASEKFVPLVKENASLQHNMAVREQALIAWAACAPSDPALTDALIASARSEVLRVRRKAIELLGRLKPERALPALIELSRRDGDGDIRKAAEDAADEIQRVARRR